ncbi:MAG: hypothetical protein M3O50_18410 [Myxococcota bacterium]|nr:hypothetical protein [Myxococcota bacterium]
MWLEAILTKDDLHAIAAQFAPMRFRLGDNGQLDLDEPTEVSMVPGRGIRIVCAATLHWPVLGMDVPVSIRSAAVVVSLEVEARGDGAALVFKPEIEHANVALLPAMVDGRVTSLVNQELAKKHVELAWNFERTLSHVFPLPEALETTASLGLRVKAGAVKINVDALGFAVSFDTEVQRRVNGVDQAPIDSERPRTEASSPPLFAPRVPVRSLVPPGLPSLQGLEALAYRGAVAALALAAAFAFGRKSAPRRRWG